MSIPLPFALSFKRFFLRLLLISLSLVLLAVRIVHALQSHTLQIPTHPHTFSHRTCSALLEMGCSVSRPAISQLTSESNRLIPRAFYVLCTLCLYLNHVLSVDNLLCYEYCVLTCRGLWLGSVAQRSFASTISQCRPLMCHR